MSDDVKNIKVVFLGEPGCGKTSIITRFVNGTFDADQESTIGANYFSKSVEVNKVWIKMNFWDTAGKERYEGITMMYAKNAEAYVLVCQFNQSDAVESIDKFYARYIKENLKSDSQFFIVINKVDLKTEDSSVNDILNKADELHVSTFQVSAKDEIGIEYMFQRILEKIRRNSSAMSRTSINLTTSARSSTKLAEKKNCCSS